MRNIREGIKAMPDESIYAQVKALVDTLEAYKAHDAARFVDDKHRRASERGLKRKRDKALRAASDVLTQLERLTARPSEDEIDAAAREIPVIRTDDGMAFLTSGVARNEITRAAITAFINLRNGA